MEAALDQAGCTDVDPDPDNCLCIEIYHKVLACLRGYGYQRISVLDLNSSLRAEMSFRVHRTKIAFITLTVLYNCQDIMKFIAGLSYA